MCIMSSSKLNLLHVPLFISHVTLNIMCCAFNHQNNIEMDQGDISLSISPFLVIHANTSKETKNALTYPKCELKSAN
jgi:hypothetical protein